MRRLQGYIAVLMLIAVAFVTAPRHLLHQCEDGQLVHHCSHSTTPSEEIVAQDCFLCDFQMPVPVLEFQYVLPVPNLQLGAAVQLQPDTPDTPCLWLPASRGPPSA